MAIETITIKTFTKNTITGIQEEGTQEITGQVFEGSIGTLTRSFIIHKNINKKQKNYVLTDVKTTLRVGYLEATTKKAATVDLAKQALQALIEKHGIDRITQTFHNADLQAGLKPQI